MNFLKTLLAVLAGFLLACILLPYRSAKAGGMVWVKEANTSSGTVVLGANVVGFSCAQNGRDVECYIASQ